MKIFFRALLLLQFVAGVTVAQQTNPKIAVAVWPQDKHAAISLTFDDGMDTHLDVVGPILKRHHLNGTFFVTTGRDPWQKRKEEWRRLAKEGNELGNHTVHHPCLLEPITPHSQDYTPEMMEAEIRDAALEISRLLNTHRGLTFAYPCGNISFGPPRDQARNAGLFVQYVSQYAFAARGYGTAGSVDPDGMSILTLPDLGLTDGKNFIGLLALAEPAINTGQWGVYAFHGVGGEWLSISADTLDELAAYLESHSEIWTAPFGDVLRYTLERKATFLEAKSDSAGTIDIAMRWPLDPEIYDLPLTLKLEVTDSWRGATINGDGRELKPSFVSLGQTKLMLVDVPVHTKNVHIECVKP